LADLFEEVEEQLRSDRYRSLALKALPWAIAIAAAALVAFFAWWGWTYYQTQQINQTSEQYAAGLDAVAQGRADEARRSFTQVSQSSTKGYKSLALMQLGGLALIQKNNAQAVTYFDQSAAAAPDDLIGDAARLRAAYALIDTTPEKTIEARLTPLLQDGHPYRVQAREALAFAKLMAGDSAGARGDFVIISGMLDAPEGARARAKAAIGLIDSGSAKAVPETVRAAQALPPTAVAPAPAPATPAPGPQ
jgi:hypothetical protein